MSEPQYIDPQSGGGARLGAAYGYSKAVRVGDLIFTAGQGGYSDPDGKVFPESLEDEIAQCFDNIGGILEASGSNWPSVISVRAFHGGEDGFTDEADGLVGAQLLQRMEGRRPTWTGVGAQLAGRMRIEIEVVAVATRPA
ncbi:Rid family hydrolase [Microbacterium atlanticum]|uniref:Rid family hydrolase n=1 Tax=Microbacterium atlanticum TaxID=2782168 RepID=UPI0018886E33|nr:Rid family hydrolase [Microbacterium atlanticum]